MLGISLELSRFLLKNGLFVSGTIYVPAISGLFQLKRNGTGRKGGYQDKREYSDLLRILLFRTGGKDES